MDNRPIGIFDSGLGGLCAVAAIRKALPHEDIVYFGDTARLPYGTRSVETLFRYAEEDIAFLKRHHVKMIMAACGTISSTVLDAQKEKEALPLFGVVEGAVQAVVQKNPRRIGIIGTKATVESGTFEKKINSALPDVETCSVACPLFVSLVENGFLEGEIPTLIAEKYLHSLRDFAPDVLILGCTHFPRLSPIISKILPDTVLIDPSAEAAKTLASRIFASGLAKDAKTAGTVTYYVSDNPEKFSENAWIFLGSQEPVRAQKITLS